MAKVRGLYQDKSGQRWAWNGYDFVKVGRDFDPRSSPFVSGVTGAAKDIGAGVQQLLLGMQGDDLALQDLAQQVQQRRQEEAILQRQNPLGFLAGQVAPYAGAAVAGGAAGAGLGGSALAAGAGATAADVALGAATYGTPGERALNAGLALGGAGAGLGAGVGARAIIRRLQGRRVSQRAQQGNLGAGGRAANQPSEQQVGLAAQLAGRMLGIGRLDADASRLRSTARARRLAEEYDVRLTPAMLTGSQGKEQLEAALMSNPWSRAPGERIRNAYLERLEKETMEFLLPGYQGPWDQDFRRAVTDSIQEGYEEIAKVSQPVKRQDVTRRAEELAQEDQASIWSSREDKIFNDLLNNVEKQGQTMQGGTAWNLQQRYAEAAARRFKAGKYEEGTAYQAVADALEESLIDAASGAIDPADLNLLRKRYRVKMALDNAGSWRGREGLKLASGYNALERAFPSELGEGRGFANPELAQLNRMFDIWTIGDKLFRPIVGDSGTATRLAFQDLSPSGIGANAVRGLAAAMYYNEPFMAMRPAAAATAVGLTGGAVIE